MALPNSTASEANPGDSTVSASRDLPVTPARGGTNPGTWTDPYLNVLVANQYMVLEVIGQGGMGVVYRANQVTVGRVVALKVLRHDFAQDDLVAKRFENEARIISRLRHPNTLRLYDCQRTERGDFFIVTELLSGVPLSRVMREGPMPVSRAVRIAEQVCGALSEAHEANIVHRDIKPENIFIDRVGREDVVKVLDFGIAKLTQGDSMLTGTGKLIGTPLYMSPEQAKGDTIDARTDVYSLGIVLYNMIAGRPPFTGEAPLAVVLKHLQEAPPPFVASSGEEMPEALEALIFQMLGKLPEQRPASIDEVRERLAEINPGRSPSLGMPVMERVSARTGSTSVSQLIDARTPTRGTDSRITGNFQTGAFDDNGNDQTFVPTTGEMVRGVIPRAHSQVGARPNGRSASVEISGGNRTNPDLARASASLTPGLAPSETVPNFDEDPIASPKKPIAAIAAALVAAAGLGILATRFVPQLSQAPEPQPQRALATGPAAAPPAVQAGVLIGSEPAGADVVGPDGTVIGQTELRVAKPVAGRYTVRMADGRTASVEVDPVRDAGRVIQVMLPPAEVAKPAEAAPAKDAAAAPKKAARAAAKKSNEAGPLPVSF